MAASSFSFPTSSSFMTTSFTDLLASSDDYPITKGLGDRIAERTGSGVPKFKSLPPPSLPLSPPPFSPSSYFAIPPGLSPTELLDSPVLLSSSNVCTIASSLLFCFLFVRLLMLSFCNCDYCRFFRLPQQGVFQLRLLIGRAAATIRMLNRKKKTALIFPSRHK